MQQSALFKRLGFPRHSEKVYNALLRHHEPLMVTKIAEVSGLPRMTVYRCLTALVTHALILPEQHGKRMLYRGGNPKQLQRLIALTERAGEALVSQDVQEYEKSITRHIRFLHGPQGIQAAFDDVISHTPKGETFFRYTSEQDLDRVNQYLARDYRERRDNKKLERLVISNTLSGSKKRSRLERFIKCIPAGVDQFEQNIIQLIYGQRIAIIDLEKETVMIIEHERLAQFQKVIFTLLYKKL